MKPAPTDLHRRIADALERLQVATDAAGRRAADAAGLSSLQMRLLRAVVRQPGRRAGDLGRALEVTPGTLSAALGSLDRKGLVTKERDLEEHRAVLVHPRPRGRELARELDAWPDGTVLPLVEELGEQEAGQVLAALLTVLRAAEARGLVDANRMCLHCRHFRPWGGSPAQGRPHRCDLLDSAIAAADLQVDCPEFDDVGAEARAAHDSVLLPD